MFDAAQISKMDRANVLHPFTHLKDFASGKLGDPAIVTGGSGIRITEAIGRALIDGFAGLCCVNIGYGRPKLPSRRCGPVLHLVAISMASNRISLLWPKA